MKSTQTPQWGRLSNISRLGRLAFSVLLLCAALMSSATSGTGAPDSRRSGVVEAGRPRSLSAGKRTPTPEGVGSNVNVTQNSSPQNETTIAADPDNPLNLVAGTNDYRAGDSGPGFAYSFDGGLTWQSDTLAAINPAFGKYDAQGDPAVAAYRGGVFYYAYIDFSRSSDRNRLVLAKTLDGGVTWPQLTVLIDHPSGGTQDFEDKEYIAVDNSGGIHDGNVYFTWTRFPAFSSTRIMFSRSTDGGLSFSNAIQISDGTSGYQGSVPAVGPEGEIYVVWLRNSSVQFDRSLDGGLTWGPDTLVANISVIPSPLPGAVFRTNSFPTIAVDRSGGENRGTIYVAWADRFGVGNGPDILLSRSTNGGATWSGPVRVTDDTNGSYQWFPWLSVAPDGGVNAVFFDRRDAPSTTLYHTYHARSTTGGLSFGPNLRVSDEISESLNDGFGGGFIGDYNGITSSQEATSPFWTDTRPANPTADGFVAGLTGSQLGVSGTCPGMIRVSLGGATANRRVVLLAALSEGSFTLPAGRCAGTVLDLQSPTVVRLFLTDANGGAFFVQPAPPQVCGTPLQALDLLTCQTSNVAQIP
ncbi:MAG: sialidase family protein [Acidobacteriota bacterium]